MATGGSRTGAGRPSWHLKAEHCQHIDVRSREPNGWLTWGDGDELFNSANGVQMRQRLTIVRTPCNFGGERSWFGCPECGRRVAVLYMRSPTGYACRKCNRISYFSQTEDALGRIWRRQVKIERRLGVDRERPPGMHQITSEWLLKQLATCEATRYGMAAVFLRGRAAAISLQLLPDARPHRDRVG